LLHALRAATAAVIGGRENTDRSRLLGSAGVNLEDAVIVGTV